MDHALVADESSRLLACTLLRHAQPDDPDAAFFATVLGKCLALGDPPQRPAASELRALLETLFPGALDDTSAELEALRPQLQAYEARGLDDPQPGFRCCCACC